MYDLNFDWSFFCCHYHLILWLLCFYYDLYHFQIITLLLLWLIQYLIQHYLSLVIAFATFSVNLYWHHETQHLNKNLDYDLMYLHKCSYSCCCCVNFLYLKVLIFKHIQLLKNYQHQVNLPMISYTHCYFLLLRQRSHFSIKEAFDEVR